MVKPNYVLIAFLSYVISFNIYLLIPESVKAIHWDPGNLHIHHYFYGILSVFILFLPAIYSEKLRKKVYLSAVYGLSLFLLVDEITMVIWLGPNMDESHPLRHLPDVLVMAVFLLTLLIMRLRKNKIPK